jgi:hypothetical protein
MLFDGENDQTRLRKPVLEQGVGNQGIVNDRDKNSRGKQQQNRKFGYFFIQTFRDNE